MDSMNDQRAEETNPEGEASPAGGLFRARPAIWALLLFYAAYVGAGAFADGLRVLPGVAVIFWPPVGIMIATLLLSGRASWPWWIAVGCAAELTANSLLWHNPLPYASLYYTGNALEAVTAALLISRFAPKPFRFETIEQVLWFVILAAGIAPMVSAAIISAVDAFRGRHAFTTGWPLVWLGDATGLLISAPLTFVAVQAWRERHNIPPARLIEAGTALVLLLSIGIFAMAGPLPTIYLTLPFLLWIAARFRLKGTAVALGLLTLMVGSFTVAGQGQFAMPSPVEHFNLIRFHVFLAVSAISSLFVAALSQQRLTVLADLETANRDLERRVTERTSDLLESEARLRLATEAASTGIWEWDIQSGSVRWSDRCYEIHGVSRDDFDHTVDSYVRLIHPDDRDRAWRTVSEAIENESLYDCDFRIIHPNGKIRWVSNLGRALNDAGGIGRRMSGTVMDITDRKQAETVLRSANTTFRQLIENSPFGIYVIDADFKLAQVSAGAQKVFESVRPLIGRDFAEVLRIIWEEPFATDAINIFRNTLETGKPYHSPRTIETRGDIGQVESYDWKTERITMPDGRFGVVCHFYDLSERQRYEADLREAEIRFRSTFEQAAVGIAHVSPDGRWLLVNERLCEITGYSRSELAELTFQQITHPDDLDDDLRYLHQMLDGDLDHYAINKRYLRKNGTHIWVNLTVSLVRDADGSPRYFIAVVEDITERKRTEEALMASEELLASMFSGVEAAITISKVINGNDFRVLSVNRACVDRTGIPFDKWKGSRLHDVLPSEVADAVTGRYREAVREGRPIEYEEKIPSPSGDVWALTTVTPLRDHRGEISRVIATSIDISKRKAAEQALSESETRQRLALEAGGMGTWTMSLDGRRGWADERTLALFDIPVAEWNGDIAAIHSRRFPEDVEANSQTFTDEEGRTSWRSEFRVQHRDGSIKWIAGVARIEYGPDASPRLMRGIYFDITERKQAEEELRRHHETLEETVRERTRELAAAINDLEYENRQRRIVEQERQMLLSRLVAVQEEERRRIAQDLHDHLGQQLTALNMKLDVAHRTAAEGDGTGHLSEARAMLRRIDDDVDALAWQLRPAMLDDDGFVPALRRYVEDWSARCRVPAEFWADDLIDAPGFLSSEAETNLYRITQEALNNIAKYANAESVEVLLKRRNDAVVLLIQDDGVGFEVGEPGKRRSKTMGLVGMRERAGLVGGTFQIESAPGEGTTIYVQVPAAVAEANGSGLMQSAGS